MPFLRVPGSTGGGGGTGDVIGPGSSVDLGITVFSGLTGKIIADSVTRNYGKLAANPVGSGVLGDPVPAAGDIYFNTVIERWRRYDGVTWTSIPVQIGYRPWANPPSIPATIVARIGGDDILGLGTVLSPYATIERAIRDIGDNNGTTVTVDVGPGVFALPDVIEIPSWVTVQGTESDGLTATQSGAAISGTAARLEIPVTGFVGALLDSLKTELIEWTGGAALGRRGEIRRNGPTVAGVTPVVVTQDSAASLIVPGIGDTFKVVNRDTEIAYTASAFPAIFSDGLQVNFKSLHFTTTVSAALFLEGPEKCGFRDCLFELGGLQTPAQGRVELFNCYVLTTGNPNRGVLSSRGGQIVLIRGSVVDASLAAAGSDFIEVSNRGRLRFDGQTFARALGAKGLLMDGSEWNPQGAITPGVTTLTFDECDGGIRINSSSSTDGGLSGWYRTPELFTDTAALTRAFGIEAEDCACVVIPSTSVFVSASGTNLVSADGGVTNCAQADDTTFVQGGSPAFRGFAFQPTVEAKTAPYAIVAACDQDKTFTNEGATGAASLRPFNLPTAVAGQRYTFVTQDPDLLQIVAAAGDTIRLGSALSVLGGIVVSTAIGDVLELIAINADEWIARLVVGTWTVT